MRPLVYALVGTPNCGKTTLFNALTSGHAASSNHPFTFKFSNA